MIGGLDTRQVPQGSWWPHAPENPVFQRLATDTRQIFRPGDTLFFCLRGTRHDGHNFIREAFQQGIRHIVTDHLPDFREDGLFYWIVPDTLAALQHLAGAYRRSLAAPVTAITGSNGKTMVKEWLYTLLREDYRVFRSPKSYNSQVGVALSLAMAGPADEIALLEAGISLPGEMARLEAMLTPDNGILTSLGSAHDEGFPDRKSKLKEKLTLFRSCAWYVAPAGIRRAHRELFDALPGECLTWAEEGEADLVVQEVKETENGQRIRYRFSEGEGEYFLPHGGAIARRNSLTCLLYALHLGIDRDALHRRMAGLPSLTMRLETREGWQQNLIISDHYNADLDALGLALDYYRQRKGQRAGWLILSDLDQSGLSDEEVADHLAQMLQPFAADRLTYIGRTGPFLATRLRAGFRLETYPDTPAFLAAFRMEEVHHTTILLKGARRFTFEEIGRRLVKYSHRTTLEIHLAALSHNLHQYARHIPRDTRTLVMVKASAYGGGGPEIARWLDLQRADYLGVAYADEGVELRKAGIRMPVLVLNPDEPAFPLITAFRLEPELYALHQMRDFLHFLGPADPVIPVHLKLETGMHRLGFTEEDLPEVLRLIRESGQVQVASVFSHLAASEDPAQDDFTHQQAARFQKLAGILEEGLGYRPLRHLLNSSGIWRFPQYAFDMVRVGIGLYGLDAAPGARELLKPAMALRARVSRVHAVPAGEGVGYGRRGVSDRDRIIATVSIGYADGLLRLAGEGRYALRIRDRLAPVVGTVCMDMTMVDVTDIPGVQPGDEVTVFDDQLPIGGLAEVLQTIPYEVLTNISPRVPRIYIEE